ncbi:MAG: hypothetical protein ACJ77K_04745 [Bacteroidia bacterium]
MIIYGWKGVETAQEDMQETCPNCSTTFSTKFHVVCKYWHLFWIPMTPYNRTVISHCASCNQTLTKDRMPESFRLAWQNLKKGKRIPVWMFTGTIIIGAIIVWSIINGMIKDNKLKDHIQSPVVGDIFKLHFTDSFPSQYSAFKVYAVTDNYIVIQSSDYQVDQESGLDELINMEYVPKKDTMDRSRLPELLNDGTIIGVE